VRSEAQEEVTPATKPDLQAYCWSREMIRTYHATVATLCLLSALVVACGPPRRTTTTAPPVESEEPEPETTPAPKKKLKSVSPPMPPSSAAPAPETSAPETVAAVEKRWGACLDGCWAKYACDDSGPGHYCSSALTEQRIECLEACNKRLEKDAVRAARENLNEAKCIEDAVAVSCLGVVRFYEFCGGDPPEKGKEFTHNISGGSGYSVHVHAPDGECSAIEPTIVMVACNETSNPNALKMCDLVSKILDGTTPLATPLSPERRKRMTEVLKVALPKLDKITWDREASPSAVAACKAPTLSTDCDFAQHYLSRFPKGTHADEANKLLAATASKRAKLAKAEDAAKAQTDAAAATSQAKKTAALKVKVNACYGACFPKCIANGADSSTCRDRCWDGCDCSLGGWGDPGWCPK